jgi:hypothetical protein
MVLGESLLGELTPGSRVTALSFRVDGAQTAVPAQTVANYEIRISRSANPPGSLSLIFANNRGSDEVLARSGPLVIAANDFPGGNSPNAFGLAIPFTTPYVYRGGPLLIEFAHDGFPAGGRFADADFPTALASETVFGTGFGATNADLGAYDELIVLQLEVQPPVGPAPAVSHLGLAVLLVLLLGVAAARLSAKQRSTQAAALAG